MRPIMLLNVSSQAPPNTVSCGLDAQKQTETDAREGEGRQLGRCTAELRLILNYDSLFAFMAKHLQLKRFSRTLSRPFPLFAFSLSIFLCLSVSLCLLTRAGLQKFIMLLKDIGEGLCKTLPSAIN